MFQRALRPATLICTLACFACGDVSPCADSSCSVGPLSESHYCGDPGDDCLRLESLSEGCIGSHTEQTCESCAGTFIRVGGFDDVDLYFVDSGELVAARLVDEGDATCEAWFGQNLSDCVAVGEPVQVLCDGSGGRR